ncbi:GNAT family N-acetyltransferase [Salinarimonas ramus]|uniref:GCN5 family N-acetyltransferase n=1 Tax=Salinarimonas ramus TaxID=690164 RepID=A0A917QDC9_9HYPH|nr:N-acetyltransferase [Salinarimonas ramus]GGK44734.1 GCN5 family N-acetyltransferase [Salinarimonas ramus]
MPVPTPDPVTIRKSRPDDLPALERLYRDAFPQEDLVPVVRALTGPRADVLGLVATGEGDIPGEILGHVAFTLCGVDGPGSEAATVALLAPLAVDPARQRSRIGSALVREGLARMRARGAAHALVLGDPGYYGRFGFREETGIAPPHEIPDAWRPAWQGLSLADGAEPRGTLVAPEPWTRAELWA